MLNEDRSNMIGVTTCKNWIEKKWEFWKGKIFFCCFTDKSFETYKKYFKELLNVN